MTDDANQTMGTSAGNAGAPRHVAIIMDGNGRWAKQRGLSRIAGHRAGAEAVRRTVEACSELGVHYLTLYAFSTENWRRPRREIGQLMELLGSFLDEHAATLKKHDIRLNAIGDIQRLPKPVQRKLSQTIKGSAANKAGVLTLALSYGARDEIVRAVQALASQVAKGKLAVADIDESAVSHALYTHDMPDPDLVIRTSGEHRLSNFLLWQASYAEFWFTPVLWPDFGAGEFAEALAEYRRRKRRFGGVEDHA